MKSIAFFNNKGGVGKTTLLCNLAAQFALHRKKSVLIIDADPQCNATQSIFTDDQISDTYGDTDSFTVYSIIKPLSHGKGYAKKLAPQHSKSFGIDLIPGDPRLALMEDLLAGDWNDALAGKIRGLRTTYLFKELLSNCTNYDYVFFDVGPSLGSINRSVLLACDYFLSPISIDIFSLRAVEHISSAISKWKKDLNHGLGSAGEEAEELPDSYDKEINLKFLGYVTQQYTAKTDVSGKKRAVNAYEKIMKKIPGAIEREFIKKLQPKYPNIDYNLGSVPNLHSLVPLSQSNRKPISELKSKDGVVGAHFSKVNDAYDIFDSIASHTIKNIAALDD